MRREDSAWWSAGFTAEWWKSLTVDERGDFLDQLDDYELESFYKDWRIWARDKQLAPEGIWSTWLLLAGRGSGKTRTAVEFIQDRVQRGEAESIALIGQGAADIRTVMVEGVSGFLRCAPSWCMPKFYPSVAGGVLHWPNGAIGYVYSAMDPESLRGPEFDLGWFDEPMAVPAAKRTETVYNLRFGLRGGENPRLLYTTTPKPHRWLRELKAKADKEQHLPIEQRKTVVTTGSTLENAENLAASYLAGILDDYDGTSLGRQEIYAEILGDEEGALWTPDVLDKQRVELNEGHNDPFGLMQRKEFAESCDRVIVAVDPNVTAGKSSHAAGIVVCARKGSKRFAIDDWSVKGQSPARWARQAILACQHYGASEIVAEVNQGGDLVAAIIHQVASDMGVDIKVVKVRATKGKVRRADPVAAAYERGQVHHLGRIGNAEKPGRLYKLETQMCALHDGYDPTGEDFDRADALVWGMTRLGLKKSTLGSGSSFGVYTFGDFNGAAA